MANARARELRKTMTPQEIKLWVRLRELRRLGFHFRRQAPRDGYILDFICLRRRVIVEVDGGQHGLLQHQTRDAARDEHFKSQGFEVLRFWNSDIDCNLDGVIEAIFQVVQRGAPTPAPLAFAGVADPPPEGEG